jgi:alpha,alpha-trehalase
VNHQSDMTANYLPISDYALIGDCHSAALVSSMGSIDWYCPVRFDAPAVFLRILDSRKGGYFSVAPVEPSSSRRHYIGDTNILQTIFSTPTGEVVLTDLMPIYERRAGHEGYDVGSYYQIMRLVEARGGASEVDLVVWPTPDYARGSVEWSLHEGGAVARTAEGFLALACPGIPLEVDEAGRCHARVALSDGQLLPIKLTHRPSMEDAIASLDPSDVEGKLAETRRYWLEWVDYCAYEGPYREQVLRSALALKLMTYEPTGAIIAAPTTSLPEEIGGVRNWDYRFTWLRDSALILYALMNVGYMEEARDFFDWLRRVEEEHPADQMQIMYTLDGGSDLTEIELEHLEGYLGSRPVRIGNGAAEQVQLDIYGEVVTAAYVYFHAGNDHEDPSIAGGPDELMWNLMRGLIEVAKERWQEPDKSIWEVRGPPQQFTYSRLMCWAALDRGVRMAEEFDLPAPIQEWREVRDAIREAILTEGYDEELGAFTQALGTSVLDAAALAIPLVGFLAPTEPRVQSTLNRIQQDLTSHGMVYRYLADDGLPGHEGTFVLCTFWLVSALALSGRVDEARDLFENTIKYANDVGLLSEEIDPDENLLLGNFPQGFTHLALISAAVDLAQATTDGALDQAEVRSAPIVRARAANGLRVERGPKP